MPKKASLAGAFVHLGFEKAGARALLGLRTVEGNVGLAKNVGGGVAILRHERDPDAGADAVSPGPDIDRCVKAPEHAERDAVGGLAAGEMPGDDGELVAAQPRQEIALPHD